MTPQDLVWNTVFTRCMAAGCTEVGATNAATSALDKYKRNQFTKVDKLIDSSVTEAKKLIVKKSKNAKNRS